MGESEKNVGGGRILRGLLGVEPCFCAWPHHPPDSPQRLAALPFKVLKNSESAARPVGRYLVHANAVVRLVLVPSCCVGVLLHVAFCVPCPPSPQ